MSGVGQIRLFALYLFRINRPQANGRFNALNSGKIFILLLGLAIIVFLEIIHPIAHKIMN